MNNKIRVVVCDDMLELCDATENFINKSDVACVVGKAYSADMVVEVAQKENPDVILMDIQMESEHAGIIATEKILKINPKIKVIMLTMHCNSQLITDAYMAGAVDYIEKDSGFELVLDRIVKVYENDDFLGPKLVRNLRKNIDDIRKKESSFLFFINGFSTLTQTEKNIFKLLCKGYTRKQIASQLYVEYGTVKIHCGHILKKLNFATTSEMIHFVKDIRFFENINL